MSSVGFSALDSSNYESSGEPGSLGSVTRWIESLRNGSELATSRLWELYFGRLVRLARKQLGNTPRAVYDEEDVALSAFKSVFKSVHHHRVSDDMDREALWKFMVTITLRKVYDCISHGQRKKRCPAGPSKVVAYDPDLLTLVSREPMPELVAEFDESFEKLLECLIHPDLKQIVALKINGYTNREIATELNRGLSTVERKLKTIREIWHNEFLT